MKLKEPIAVREKLMQRRGWNTIDEIAANLGMSTNTISRALRGEPVRIVTVTALARAIESTANDIAELAGKSTNQH